MNVLDRLSYSKIVCTADLAILIIIFYFTAYSLTVFKESGGDPKSVLWNPDKVLENLITNCRRQKREGYTYSSDEEDIMNPENSDIISPDDLDLSDDRSNLSSDAQNVNSDLDASPISSVSPDIEISNSVTDNSKTTGETNNNGDLARNLNMQVGIQEPSDSLDLSVDCISITPLKPTMILWEKDHDSLDMSRDLDFKEL